MVEAEGGAGRALKARAGHGPVVPGTADAVIMVAGLAGLGRPLGEDTVFRSAVWAELTGTSPGETISPRSLAAVLAHERGLGKGTPPGARRIAFLNGVGTASDHAVAGRVAAALESSPGILPDRVAVGRLLPDPTVEPIYA